MKRIAGIIALIAMAGLLTGAPAHAEEGPGLSGYVAKTDAQALVLNVLGQSITIGGAHAELDSALKASASGLGLATPLITKANPTAAVTGDGQTNGSADLACEDAAIPELPLLSLDTACGAALAKVAGGLPSAIGSGKVGAIGVGVADLLADTPLADVADTLHTTVDDLLTQLEPVFAVVEQTGVDADSLLKELLNAILDGGQLVNITLGEGTSMVEVNADGVLSSGTAAAGTIKVLDRSLLQLPPVLTITVGSAKTSVSRSRATGIATSSFDPAIVTVDIADDIVALVPGLPSELSVAPGQNVCIPLPPPLESCIQAGYGETSTLEDGTAVAHAAAVRLDLLKGLPGGGIVLALAETNSAVVATLNVPAPPAVDTPRGSLPRTGAESAISFALAIVLAGAAGVGLTVSRRARRLAAD